MKSWAEAIRIFEQAIKRKLNFQFFLLELDIVGGKLNISGYKKNQEDKAISDYARAEKRNKGKKEYDVVLVGADTTSDLRKAYPNYFVDTDEFLQYLKKIVEEK